VRMLTVMWVCDTRMEKVREVATEEGGFRDALTAKSNNLAGL
jgi:hypothetical protein